MAEQTLPTFDQVLTDAARVMGEPKDSRHTQIAAVLLSSAFVGTSRGRLEKFTGYSRELVEHVIEGAKRNGIFRGRRVDAEWFDEGGGMSLVMDAMTVEGLLERA